MVFQVELTTDYFSVIKGGFHSRTSAGSGYHNESLKIYLLPIRIIPSLLSTCNFKRKFTCTAHSIRTIYYKQHHLLDSLKVNVHSSMRARQRANVSWQKTSIQSYSLLIVHPVLDIILFSISVTSVCDLILYHCKLQILFFQICLTDGTDANGTKLVLPKIIVQCRTDEFRQPLPTFPGRTNFLS